MRSQPPGFQPCPAHIARVRLAATVGPTAVLVALLPEPLASQSCLDDWRHPEPIVSMSTRGSGLDFVRRGDYAYLADGNAGVTVVDVSNIERPQIVGQLPTDRPCSEIAIGNYLFALDDAVDIIDVTDPRVPVVAGSLGPYREIEAFDDYLVGVSREGLFTVIDVGQPTRPVIAATLSLGSITAIAIEGSLACVGTAGSGGAKLQVINLKVPSSPKVHGALELPNRPWELSVDGTLAYSNSWTSGIDVIDVHDPTRPNLLTHLDLQFESFVVEDGRGYGIDPGLWFYDLTDPASPTLLANSYIPGLSMSVAESSYHSLASIDDHVLVLRSGAPPGHGTLSAFRWEDTAPPEQPHQEAEFPVINAFLERDVGVVYVGTDDGLRVYDLSEPLRPLELLRVPTTAIAALESSGNLLVAGTKSNAGFAVVLFDVSRPQTPVELGRTETIRPTDYGTALDLIIRDNFVYVTSYEEFFAAWLTIVDITARNAPQVAGRLDLRFWGGWEGTAWSGPRLALSESIGTGSDSGGHLFVTRSRGFAVYSLDDPVELVEVGSYYRPWHMSSGIAILGSRMYLSMHARHEWYDPPPPAGTKLRPGLHVFDVTSPATPMEITFVESVNHADRLLVRHAPMSGSDLALVGVESSGIHAYELVDSDHPTHVGFWMPPKQDGFVVAGNSLFAFERRRPNVTVAALPCAEVSVSLKSFDASVVDGSVHLQWQVNATAVTQDFRLEGSWENQRWTVDVTSADDGGFEATDLAPAHEPIASSEARRIRYDLYTSRIASDWSLLVSHYVDLSGALRTRLAGASPNPFNPATLVRYELSRASAVELAVFDVRGRVVRTLVRQRLGPGYHAARWDGRDASGRDVASGVYRVRLRADRHIETKSLVVVR